MNWFGIGAISAGLGVAIGAFGAHGLEGIVSDSGRLETFETGARYQMYHALALLAVGWASTRWKSPLISIAGWLFLTGTLVFSGSLYLLVLTDTPILGAITPLGGVAFISGWVLLALGVRKSNAIVESSDLPVDIADPVQADREERIQSFMPGGSR